VQSGRVADSAPTTVTAPSPADLAPIPAQGPSQPTTAARPASECYESTIRSPTPYLANGGEVIELDDGTFWQDVSYQYLYLYEYYPSVVICPGRGKLVVGEHTIDVIPM
jgi:hypothetical protein